MLDITHLREYIDDLKSTRSVLDEQIEEAQRLLAKAEGKARTNGSGSTDLPFTRKYEKSARDLIVERLRKTSGWTDTGKLREALRRDGYDFIRATFDVNLQNLYKAGVIERRESPKRSKFKWQWRLAEAKTATSQPARSTELRAV